MPPNTSASPQRKAASIGTIRDEAVRPFKEFPLSAEAHRKASADHFEKDRCAVLGPEPKRSGKRKYKECAGQKERPRHQAGCGSLAHFRLQPAISGTEWARAK